MKCEWCANYIESLDTCKFCSFEYEESVIKDDWDILNLKEEDGWEHKQILNRLHSKGIDCSSADICIDCSSADIWYGNTIAYLQGCDASTSEIANVLGLHEESIYNDYEHSLIILNLFQEKWLRGEFDE